jgi:hypothetical protein
MVESIYNVWQFLKVHDAPNWFGIVIWPLVLSIFAYWWTHRKKQSVRHFRVTFSPEAISIGEALCSAVALTFINQTGSIAYLSHARLKENMRHFPVPKQASRDMADGWRELVFALPPYYVEFNQYECLLQTDVANGRVKAAIAVTTQMDEGFYSHRPTLWRRLLRYPKYFLLEYVVVVGETKHSVQTVY